MRPIVKTTYAPCTNCGETGHQQRACIAPISSYGVILFRIRHRSWNPLEKLATSETSNLVIPMQQVEFCLIQRKDSIGFIELARGKYNLEDFEYLQEQFNSMTDNEREYLRTKPFEDLWIHVWGSENKYYRHDFEVSRDKFNSLKKGIINPKDGSTVSLETLINGCKNHWDTPEWGFPKGRRNRYETDLDCAIRETCEETGLKQEQFHILHNLSPIRETFFGDNNVYYTHIYYLAWCPMDTSVEMKSTNECMLREIGDIGWFSLDEALNKIRPTNLEKREILLQASRILKNTCPIVFQSQQGNPLVRQDERQLGPVYQFIDDE
jgi:8-oxo-dGTP pyrophosphatase MutT (NUDIX family)